MPQAKTYFSPSGEMRFRSHPSSKTGRRITKIPVLADLVALGVLKMFSQAIDSAQKAAKVASRRHNRDGSSLDWQAVSE